jgi:phosphoribosylanthranilate isomerase
VICHDGGVADATRIKICGITGLDDAQRAVEAGAWAVVLILWPGSPRACDLEQAELIARTLRRSVEVCGVFVNPHLDEVSQRIDALGLTMVQLHGDEGPAFCAEVRRRTGVRVIKAAQVGGLADLQALEPFHTDFHLLDTHHPNLRGGTGETWDWELLGRRHSKVPLLMSGGLTAENVGAAIHAARPFGVDGASGTESAPGRKDPAKLTAFTDAVRRADAELAAAAEEAAEAQAEAPA